MLKYVTLFYLQILPDLLQCNILDQCKLIFMWPMAQLWPVFLSGLIFAFYICFKLANLFIWSTLLTLVDTWLASSSSLRLNMSCPSFFFWQPCIPFFAFHIPCCQPRSLHCSLHPVHCPLPDLPKSHLHDPSIHCLESLHFGWDLMDSRMSGIKICYAHAHLLVHIMWDHHFTMYWRYKLHYHDQVQNLDSVHY